MAKFKVGDKVRSLVTQIDVRAGELYEVGRMDADGDVWVIDDVGDNWYLTSNEFETLPVVEEPEDMPAFKVGDRVRVIAKTGARMPDIGVVGVICDCDDGYKVAVEGVGAFGYDAHDLELVPMLLEHGRYYRSRNGRKIGPVYVVNSQAGGCIADDGDECHPYRRDGTIMYSDSEHLDLIAEWIDEPVKATPKPALKRGDKVKITVDRPGYALLKGDVGTLLEDDNDTAPYISWERTRKVWAISNEDLELVINDSDPAKSSAPVAVQQEEPELTVTLSFDAADITNTIKSTLLKTNQGYGFEIARHGDYVWVDTGKKAPIVLKATDVQAAA